MSGSGADDQVGEGRTAPVGPARAPGRRDADAVVYELKATVKEAIRYLANHHRPGVKRDIMLFATRRGGSTWLMEIIAANRGVKYLDQPLSIMTDNLTAAQFRRLPKFEAGELVHLAGADERRVEDVVSRLLSGQLTFNAPTRFWRRGFHVRTDRVVLKIVAAKAVIDWLDQHFDVDVVYLTRHPIPQALSCIRNGWTLTTSAYLQNPWFAEHHLGDRLGTCQDISASGSPLEQFTLNWALENLVPLRLLPQRPNWLHVSYEECVLQPEVTLERAVTALQLEDVDAMRRVMRKPSWSSGISTAETRRRIGAGDPEFMIGRWKRSVTDEEERAALRILEVLGIDLYRPGSLLPTPGALT